MHPKEFSERWHIKAGELAQLLNRSVTTVEHWLMEGESRREPPEDILKILTAYDIFFGQLEQIEDLLPAYLLSLYEVSKVRRSLSNKTE